VAEETDFSEVRSAVVGVRWARDSADEASWRKMTVSSAVLATSEAALSWGALSKRHAGG